jgi:hypothetical protein
MAVVGLIFTQALRIKNTAAKEKRATSGLTLFDILLFIIYF